MGCPVLLVTFDRTKIGAMSCNPAIGGIGKGHLVREVDALGGVLGRAADDAAIHYRMLNRSKGSAVWGPRVQADRTLFRRSVQAMVDQHRNLRIVEGEVVSLILNGDEARGVRLATGEALAADAVILCTGTFLGGTMFCGEWSEKGGRDGEAGALELSRQLRAFDLPIARLKTGTPPRLDGRTIDWASLERQPSDSEDWTMSAWSAERHNPPVACAITRTNARTHAIIRENLERSPIFSGAVGATGPRYCPSIEDKIHRFADREGHQVFLEPEGLDTHLVYPNGISTSLPADVQHEFLRTMNGLERVEVAAPGYAVEYDYIDPRALGHDLQSRAIRNLYCAGQINGTTGYEEAAAQGLAAGMYAAAAALDRPVPALARSDSYIGVLIDDLVLQGVSEPYRMLTSRAEYRLKLRAGNAVTRLAGYGRAAGLYSSAELATIDERQREKAEVEDWFEKVQPGLDDDLRSGSRHGRTPAEWAASGHLDVEAVLRHTGDQWPAELVHEVLEDAAYAPYLARQAAELNDVAASENVALPPTLDYTALPGLSNEMAERLQAARPATMGEAGRIRGITPAALALLLVHSRRAAA